jgi:hypothetical protein
MLDLIFIGTLHCGFTPNKDLEQIFLDYKPSTLLIEITQEDINSNTIENYPPEMQFALQYSKKNNIPFFGFDSNIDVTLKGSTKEDEKKLFKNKKK